MIIGILAILKAGVAYAPLDPLYTSDCQDIIKNAAILLVDEVGRKVLGDHSGSLVISVGEQL